MALFKAFEGIMSYISSSVTATTAPQQLGRSALCCALLGVCDLAEIQWLTAFSINHPPPANLGGSATQELSP